MGTTSNSYFVYHKLVHLRSLVEGLHLPGQRVKSSADHRGRRNRLPFSDCPYDPATGTMFRSSSATAVFPTRPVPGAPSTTIGQADPLFVRGS